MSNLSHLSDADLANFEAHAHAFGTSAQIDAAEAEIARRVEEAEDARLAREDDAEAEIYL